MKELQKKRIARLRGIGTSYCQRKYLGIVHENKESQIFASFSIKRLVHLHWIVRTRVLRLEDK